MMERFLPTLRGQAHPGESLRDALAAKGWTVTEAAAGLGCRRRTFSRVLNGRTGISPAMALALERIGWSNAAFRVRRQAQYDLAQETHPPGAGSRLTGRRSAGACRPGAAAPRHVGEVWK